MSSTFSWYERKGTPGDGRTFSRVTFCAPKGGISGINISSLCSRHLDELFRGSFLYGKIIKITGRASYRGVFTLVGMEHPGVVTTARTRWEDSEITANRMRHALPQAVIHLRIYYAVLYVPWWTTPCNVACAFVNLAFTLLSSCS